MSFPTLTGKAVNGVLLREPRVDLGPSAALYSYKFFVTGTSTPANVYEDGNLSTPFSPTGVVTADGFGRFPAIYLDTSITYKVQLYNSSSVLVRAQDPYVPPLATTGTSSTVSYGFSIAPTGEVTIKSPASGGSGIALTLRAGGLGSSPLELNGSAPGSSAIIVNNSATTGSSSAVFTAHNKPGTAASSPAGWLPITCDGVQYYTPIWHGNTFEYYTPSPSVQGINVLCSTFSFNGDGSTTLTITVNQTPPNPPIGNWFIPTTGGVGASYYINITKTSGLSGLTFSAAQGAWTNIGSGGLNLSTNAQSLITGTYQMSPSVTGSPVVASGELSLISSTGVVGQTYGTQNTNITFNGDGTVLVGGTPIQGWYTPTTSNIGSGYWVNFTRTGGNVGANFSVAQGSWVNITNAGLTVGVSGGVPGNNVNGTFQIASDSAGVNVLGAGSITLTE